MSRRGLIALGLLAGCGADPSPPVLLPLPRLDSVTLSDERTWVARHVYESPPDLRNSADPRERLAMLADGLGEYDAGPGEPHVRRLPEGVAQVPAPGPAAHLLLRFAHLSDAQLADDESPSRVASLDGPGATDAAFRPHEAHMCRVLNAAVRTLDGIHQHTPIAFLLTGGDNIDNAQSNELAWFMAILSGAGPVDCDSGDDDDPQPGPSNDPKDAFAPFGLDLPWYWVTGNHDVCLQGNFVVDRERVASSTGDQALAGTRDWSLPGAPVVNGNVPADARRRPLTRAELMAAIAADGDGHGIGDAQLASGKAFYEFDVPGSPLRFVVLDTAAESGGAAGVLHQADLDAVVRPMLDRARDEQRWVVLAAHHGPHSLSDGSDFGGTLQNDALTREAWQSFLAAYPNIVLDMVGHSHAHRVEHPAGFWQILTSALADHPHQFRVIEIWDQDNGWLTIKATGVDFATDDDSIAEEGRQLGLLDRVSGWWSKGSGTVDDRNVELWTPRP